METKTTQKTSSRTKSTDYEKRLKALEKKIETLEQRQDLFQELVSRLAAVKAWWPQFRDQMKW